MLVVKRLTGVERHRSRTSRSSMSSDSGSAPSASRQSTFAFISNKFSKSHHSDINNSSFDAQVTPAVYPCEAKDTRSCCLSHSGTVTLTGYDKKVGVWNTLSGCRKDFTLHTGNIRQVAVSGDGKIGASAATDGTVRVFDTKTLAQYHCFKQRGFEWAQGAALSADGNKLFATFIPKEGERGLVAMYQWRENKVTKLWHGASRAFECYASHDGSRVLFIRGGGAVQILDVATAKVQCSFEYMVGNFHTSLDSSGRLIVIADKNLCVHTVTTGDHVMVTVNDYKQYSDAQCDITADGSRIIEMKRKSIIVRNARNGNRILTLTHKERLRLCRISADGCRIVACTASGSLVVWTPDTLTRTPIDSSVLHSDFEREFANNDSGEISSPWFANNMDNIPGMTLLPAELAPPAILHVDTNGPQSPTRIDTDIGHYEHEKVVQPPPDYESVVPRNLYTMQPPPPSPPPPPELSPIESLLRETLDQSSMTSLSKMALFDVLNRKNAITLSALFAGHNLLLIALRSGILDPSDLKSFMGVPYFFFSNLYLPFSSQFAEESQCGQLLAKKIFLHAEHLDLIQHGEPILAVAETSAASREEFHRIDEVLQDLSYRVGALEVTIDDAANRVQMLENHATSQLRSIAILAQNLTSMHAIMKRRDRGLMYANLAKCLLSLLPIVGGAVGNAAFSATEVMLAMSTEDVLSVGIDVSHCIIDQVANVDMSNMQVARYVFSRKGMQSAGPVAEQKIKRAIEESSFREVEALNEALQLEIRLVFEENKSMHLLNLADSRWVSGRYEPAANVSRVARAVVDLYEREVDGEEMMSYQHAIVHIASYLQLNGFRNSLSDEDIHDVLEESADGALRVNKDSFVTACETLVGQLMAAGGRTPDAWREKFEFAAKPEMDCLVRTAANVLLDIWKETSDKSGSLFNELPSRMQLRDLVKNFDSNGDGRIDKDEFLRAAHYAIHGGRQ